MVYSCIYHMEVTKVALESVKGSMQQMASNVAYSTVNNNSTEVVESATQLGNATAQAAQVVLSDGNDQNYNEEQEKKNQQKMVQSAVEHINSNKNVKTRCEFKYHEATNRVSIKIIDKDTDEVIREIPPEKTLKMVEKMWELAGLLVDEKR